MSIGNEIRRLRKGKGLTLQDLAGKMEISVSYKQPPGKPRLIGGEYVKDMRCSMEGMVKRGSPPFSLHDLRRSFQTYCEDLNIPVFTIKRLVGHALPSDVTQGYIQFSMPMLHKRVGAVAAYILRHAGRLNVNKSLTWPKKKRPDRRLPGNDVEVSGGFQLLHRCLNSRVYHALCHGNALLLQVLNDELVRRVPLFCAGCGQHGLCRYRDRRGCRLCQRRPDGREEDPHEGEEKCSDATRRQLYPRPHITLL